MPMSLACLCRYKGFSGQMVFKGHGLYETRGVIEKRTETTLLIRYVCDAHACGRITHL